MKYIKFILTYCLLFFLSEKLQAQIPNWTVNPANYQYSMTVTAVLNMNYVESTDGDDMLGAFINGECRGVAKPVFIKAVNRWIAYLFVYSNSAGDSVTFTLYDKSTDKQLNVSKKQLFTDNAQLGTALAPCIISSPTLSNEALMLSFSFPKQIRASIKKTNISVLVPYGADLSALTANFTTSAYATVTVGSTLQKSAATVNNFTSPLIYSVQSADETVTTDYKVTVATGKKLVLADTVLTLDDNIQLNTKLFQFKVLDADSGVVLTYSISDNFDNTFELTKDGILILKKYFDSEQQTQYKFKITVTDSLNNVSNSVTINILYAVKTDFSATKIISPNGDGYLDTWQVRQAINYRNCTFLIFNTFGEIVFKQTGYDAPWDGTVNGKELPIGAYYYLITSPRGESIKGTITLIK